MPSCLQCGKPIPKTNKMFCSKVCSDHSRRNTAVKPCEQCGKQIYKKYGESAYNWNRTRFCSQKCAVDSKRTGLTLIKGTCRFCGKIFHRENWRGREFCSPQCASTWYRQNETDEQRKLRQQSGWNKPSPVSQAFCSDLHSALNTIFPQLTVLYSSHLGEYIVQRPGESTKATYYIDFYIKDWKIAIEFYGDFWHANPLKYASSDRIMRREAKDIWQRDAERVKFLEEQGIKVIVVWESDYKHRSDPLIPKLIRQMTNCKLTNYTR